MDNRPIGILDSGAGGLMMVEALRKLLPGEDIVYVGDTGRAPYGSRSRQQIRKYAAQGLHLLLEQEVKAAAVACGTIDSCLTEEDARGLGVAVPYTGVILPAVRSACALGAGGRIGVLATSAAIRSGIYGKLVRSVLPGARVFGQACPLLAPLAENGMAGRDNPLARMVLEMYLGPLMGENIDTLILGCTHYPLFYDIINDILEYNITLINPGAAAAAHLQALLCEEGMLAERDGPGCIRCFVTDTVDGFAETARHFFRENVQDISKCVNFTDTGRINRTCDPFPAGGG